MKQHLTSFSYLNITQFIGAFNDNLYKLLLIFYLIHIEGAENASKITAFAGAVFILPFIVFARVSGILADHFSKSVIVMTTRVIGVLIAIATLFVFYFDSSIGAYCILFAMATNSAVFVIARNSLLPELVSSSEISNANGVMSSVGFVAIILGTFSASFILDMTDRNYFLSSFTLLITTTIALFMSWFIEHTPPLEKEHKEKIPAFFLTEIITTLRQAGKHPALLSSIYGASFFLFFGAFFQLNLIPFVMESLDLSDLEGGYMFLLCAIGIGVGSIVAGKISGKKVELGLVPVASIMMAVCLFLMFWFSNSLPFIIFLTATIGFFGGMYDIPLESYVQFKSPPEVRGHIAAATKFMSSVGVLCASGLIYLLSNVLNLTASQGFLVLGFIVAIASIVYAYLYKEHLANYFRKNSQQI